MPPQEAVSPRQAGKRLQSLAGIRVLVSGGTTGIGRATARLLVEEGARVVLFGRSQDALDSALRELGALGEAHGLAADQANPADVERVFGEVRTRLGGLDVLVNDAGVSGDSVVDGNTEQWMYTMRTDVFGYMKCAELAIPLMRENDRGWIVNIGSMSAKTRDAGSDVYVAAKMAVRGFSDSLGRKVADYGIHVTLIEPGLVVSEMNEMTAQQQIERQDKLEMILGEDIGRAVVYVLSQPQRVSIPMMQVRPLMQKI